MTNPVFLLFSGTDWLMAMFHEFNAGMHSLDRTGYCVPHLFAVYLGSEMQCYHGGTKHKL